MPFRKMVSKEMSNLLKALAHPHRLQLIEELGNKELDVNTLQELLEISHSHVSQHLAVFRAHKIVTERREGRFVYYRLTKPALAIWLLEGLKFLSEEPSVAEQMREALDSARQVWLAQQQTAMPSSVNDKISD